MFNGFIDNQRNLDNEQEFIDLTPLEEILASDIGKALDYFKLSAALQNPQALFWLSYLASSQLTDPSLTEHYAMKMASLILAKPDLAFKQFNFDEIIILCDWNLRLNGELLNKRYVV